MVLTDFVRESNAIEGIYREPTEQEVRATDKFLGLSLRVGAVCDLQEVYAPGKPLRSRRGMNVRVGGHVAPPGSITMPDMLEKLLADWSDPWLLHVQFEILHPFMDGNGRTGRAVWAWAMIRAGEDPFALSFLHRFYYQTLAANE